MSFKQKLINLTLAFGSLCLTYLTLELIVPHILNHVPLTMYNALENKLRVLGQSSKSSVIPQNYIALVGDSYAQGQGDWLKKVIRSSRYKGTNPDYHSGHIIYRRTGTDVITYGMGGAGSVKGLVTAPIISHLYISSLWPYTLDQPRRILIYFYEGNDFSDNSQYYPQRFLFRGHDEHYFFKGYDENLFYDTQYFDEFLQKEALERYPQYKDDSPFRHFIFAGFLGTGWENLKKEITRGKRKLKRWIKSMKREQVYQTSFRSKPLPILRVSLNSPSKPGSSQKNIAVINGENVTLPAYLQGPPVTLQPEQMKRGLYIFERCLLFMARFFTQSEISIIYIPGPASVYSMVGPSITYEDGKGKVAPKETITKASQEGCRSIKEVAQRNGFQFLDTRPYFRELAKTKILHGPEDHQHLNRDGQTLLAEVIIKHILSDSLDQKNNVCES